MPSETSPGPTKLTAKTYATGCSSNTDSNGEVHGLAARTVSTSNVKEVKRLKIHAQR
jgi:hypothetical protein